MFSYEDMTFYGAGEDPAEHGEDEPEEVEGPPPPPTEADRKRAIWEERKKHLEHDEVVPLDDLKELWATYGDTTKKNDDDIDF